MTAMKQSIVALIRPKFNLAQKESEAAHLIEHILMSPKRLQSLWGSGDFYSQNIILDGGWVNAYYMAEYYVVRSEVSDKVAETLLKNKDNLFLSSADFEKIKSVLIEEITNDRGEFIDLNEQYSKAICVPNSPPIRNPWHDLDSVRNLLSKDAETFFQKYNADCSLLNLTDDEYKIDKIPIIEKGKIKGNIDQIELSHPWQPPGSVDTFIAMLIPANIDPLIGLLYRRSLTDFRFGLLFDELRNKNGLVYDVSVSMDYFDNTLEFWFSSRRSSSDKAIKLIEKSLKTYDSLIKKNFEKIKNRSILDLELEWGDIQNCALNIIDSVVGGEFAEPNSKLLERITSITQNDLAKFNQLVLVQFKQNAIITRRKHSKTVETQIVSKS